MKKPWWKFYERLTIRSPSDCSHKWQTRGVNKWGHTTYRLCLDCRKTQCIKGLPPNTEWIDCDPIADLDAQFDENDRLIY